MAFPDSWLGEAATPQLKKSPKGKAKHGDCLMPFLSFFELSINFLRIFFLLC